MNKQAQSEVKVSGQITAKQPAISLPVGPVRVSGSSRQSDLPRVFTKLRVWTGESTAKG